MSVVSCGAEAALKPVTPKPGPAPAALSVAAGFRGPGGIDTLAVSGAGGASVASEASTRVPSGASDVEAPPEVVSNVDGCSRNFWGSRTE